ncbi:MAG TPA: IS1182 family transposase [Gemmataceae bacterium]|jgi:transposase|nr:IS1182 family transposase [Gemmataceae bacterium]
MDDRAGKTYRPFEPEQYAQQAYSPAQKLPEGDLVYFLLDLVPQLDLSRFRRHYEDETRGAPPFDPTQMVCLLVYAYSVGVFSSRKIALACERNLAFLAIVGDQRPDFRTISDFRKIHLDAFVEVFADVLRLAGAAGMVQLGNLATDGTKVVGNASRHKAMSYGYMKKEEQRLRAEIEALLGQAQGQDDSEDAVLGSRRGDELPDELRRREERLATIQAAKQRLEEQARAEAEAERQRRQEAEADRQRRGQKRRGKEPGPVAEEPADKAQTNFTDPEMKIMKMNNKGWDYCGNAQVTVDAAFQIIVACEVTAAANDKQQAVPLAAATRANLDQAGIELPKDAAGQVQKIPATLDSGYFSKEAVAGLEALGFDPYLATGRQRHHAPAEAEPLPLSAEATAKEQMAAKVRTPLGRALYAARKGIVEPVFGQIKAVRGFRRFLLRGLAKVRGEWRLVCLTHNLLKLWRYRNAHAAA